MSHSNNLSVSFDFLPTNKLQTDLADGVVDGVPARGTEDGRRQTISFEEIWSQEDTVSVNTLRQFLVQWVQLRLAQYTPSLYANEITHKLSAVK